MGCNALTGTSVTVLAVFIALEGASMLAIFLSNLYL